MFSATNLFDSYKEADDLLTKGDLQQAADICKQMLEVNPNFAHGYHLMAALFKITGNMDKAFTFSELAIKLAPNEASFHLQQGQILLALSHFEAAARSFETAHKLLPQKAIYILHAADAYVRQGKYEHAAELFVCARNMAAPEELAEINEYEGLYMMAKGDLGAAENLFDKVIAARPNHYAGYLHKGRILLYQDRDYEAEICFAKAINCNPHSHEALHAMAVVNERQGQIDPAIAMAIQAVNTNGSLFDSMMLLGTLLSRRQNWQGAEQIFRQALSVVPDNIYALTGFAAALTAQKKSLEAQEYMQNASIPRPENKPMKFLSDALSGKNSEISPQEYAASYFNDYAGRYDFFLQNNMHRVSMIHDQLLALSELKGKTAMSLLDLGCGGGQLVPELIAATSVRVGVDLSQRMLDIARMRQYYSELYTLDITEFAMGSDRIFDIIMAIDVLPYMGALEEFFNCARNLMAPSSVLSFSIEKGDGKNNFRLMPSGRYTHSTNYIKSLLDDHGYKILNSEEILLRFDSSAPIKGETFIVKKMTLH